MRLSDDSHDYLCSTCQQRGGVCLEALWLSQRIARGLAARAHDLPEGFELTSQTLFTGCGRDCPVTLTVTGQRVDVRTAPPGGSARVTAQLQSGRALAAGG